MDKTHAEYHQATWTGIAGDEFFVNGPGYRFDLVSNAWLKEHIRENHGPLGELYLPWLYIMESDSPSFMILINNGLGSRTSPGYGGWGGRYAYKRIASGNGPIWTNTRDTVTLPDGKTYTSDQATIWRWRVAYQHDFAARMDWCVKDPSEANHNPVVVVEKDETKNVIRKQVRSGDSIKLSAKGTNDPDGDNLTYRWFHYSEASSDLADFRQAWKVKIAGDNTEDVSIVVPKEMPRGRKDIHIILDVSDNGEPSLHAYRRVVLSVQE